MRRSRLSTAIVTFVTLVSLLALACRSAEAPEERVRELVAAERAKATLLPTAPPAPTATPAPAPAVPPVTLALPTVPPTPPPMTPLPAPLTEQDAVARVLPAVVRIETNEGVGSGVILDPAGRIVTNAHVVEDASSVSVRLQSGRELMGTVDQINSEADLAVVRVSASGLPVAPLGDPELLRLGEPLMAIGFALDLDGGPTVTRGVFSQHRAGSSGVDEIQTDTPMNPGNSGGPLISLKGEVIGISTRGRLWDQGRPVTGINYAISASSVREFLDGRLSTPRSRASAGTPPSRTEASPVETVRRFYALIGARRLEEAWGLFSERQKGERDYGAWLRAFDTTQAVETRQAELVSRAGERALVAFTIVSTDRGPSGPVRKVFSGTWELVLLDGGWQLDRAAIRQVE